MNSGMKNQPDKIYAYIPEDDIVGTASTKKGVPHQYVGTEYTRTDAFIEKACEFISLNVADYIDVTHKGGIEHLVLQEKFSEGFKKYMEETKL